MPVLTDDQFAKKYFEYVIPIHLAKQKKLKGLTDENYTRSLDNPPGQQMNIFEINRKIKSCDDEFGDITKLYIQSQGNIVKANPIVFDRFTLINAFLDYLKTVSEIFGGTEWRQKSYNYAKVRKFFLYNLPMKIVVEEAIETIDGITAVLSQDVANVDDQQVFDSQNDFVNIGEHHELLTCIQNQINSQNINCVQGKAVRLDWKYWNEDSDEESKKDEMIMDNNSRPTVPNYKNLKHWEIELISPILIFQIVVLFCKRVRKFCTDNNMDDPIDLPSIYYLALKPQR